MTSLPLSPKFSPSIHKCIFPSNPNVMKLPRQQKRSHRIFFLLLCYANPKINQLFFRDCVISGRERKNTFFIIISGHSITTEYQCMQPWKRSAIYRAPVVINPPKGKMLISLCCCCCYDEKRKRKKNYKNRNKNFNYQHRWLWGDEEEKNTEYVSVWVIQAR